MIETLYVGAWTSTYIWHPCGALCVPTCYLWKWNSWDATGKGISWDSHGRMWYHRKLYCYKIKEFPSKVPSPSVSPWKKSNTVFGRARTKAIAQSIHSILNHQSPVQNMARLACVPSCSPLWGQIMLLKATWRACAGHGARKCQGAGMNPDN